MKEIISENLSKIHQKIASAAAQAGRNAEDIKMVAVTKYVPDEAVAALLELGIRDFGESRQQTLSRRAEIFCTPIRWHFIGPLQKNKIRRVIQVAHMIHSGESLDMLTAVSRIAAEENRSVNILLEVNISGEPTKHGFMPSELPNLVPEIFVLPNLQILGLMGMAGLGANEAETRRQFASLRSLRDELREHLPSDSAAKFQELSLGMSDDYPLAILEGATIIRIGSAIFE